MERKKHTKVIPTIGERDVIPFGKYKGEVLLDVYARDPSYVEWMVSNITNYKIDLYSGWEEFVHEKMYPNDEKRLGDYYSFTDDGWYLVSFWGNGWDYGLYRKNKGKIIELFDWYSVVAPFAYYRIPDYNPQNSFWGEIVYAGSNGSIITIGAYENGTEIEYKEIDGTSISKLKEMNFDESLIGDSTIRIKKSEDKETYYIPNLIAVANIPLLRNKKLN